MNRQFPVGRPSKYTPDVVYSIERHLKEGQFRETSARLSDVSVAVFNRWLVEKPEFREMVERAEEHNKRLLSRILLKHGKHAWQAVAWFMERRHSDQFSAKIPVGAGAGAVQINVVSGGYVPPALQVNKSPEVITAGEEVKQLGEGDKETGEEVVSGTK